jgi:hypothetical protein
MMMRRLIALAIGLMACSGVPGADDANPAPPPPAVGPGAVAADPDARQEATPRQICGLAGDAMLTGEGVGAFTVGAAAAEVRADCPAAADTTIRDVEGMIQRVLALPLDSGAIRAMIVDDAVWRVHVTDPTLETASGISVGTTLSELLQHEAARGMMGEGALYVALPDHCGMSFRLDTEPGEISGGGEWTAERLAELPGSTPVDEILAFGCAGAGD